MCDNICGGANCGLANSLRPQGALPLPMGEVPSSQTGRRGYIKNSTPSQSKIGCEELTFASSPGGRAKGRCRAIATIGPADRNLDRQQIPPIAKIGIYFFCRMVYSKGEQSRKPCVKCCQNGELCDRRRTLSAIGYPHPLRHNGFTSFMKQRYSVGRLVGCFLAALPQRVIRVCKFSPLTAFAARGVLHSADRGAAPWRQTHRLLQKGGLFYGKTRTIH